MRRITAALALLALLSPATLAAQGASTAREPRPLGIPAADLRCRALPLAAEDSTRGATQEFEWELGDVRSREERDLRATYDASGRPLGLIAMVTFASGERGLVLHAIAVRFGRGGDAVGVHARQAQNLAAAADPRPGTSPGRNVTKTLEALTPEEQREAGELARWLWTKRCGQPGG